MNGFLHTNPMNRKKLQSMIEQSLLLTPDECAFWLEKLPTLDEQTCVKLEKLLTITEDKSMQKKLSDYFGALNSAIQNFTPANKTA
jgi:hypothetical protein